ncbi:MAG: nuclear transport factor 2 family protein [Bacteroidota bacterium]
MTTQEVANQLVNYCRQGQYEKAQEELYADHAVSIEPKGAQGPERTEGIAGIKAKGEQWAAMVEEIHGAEITDPIVAANFFSCAMRNDITFKGQGRMTIEEVCVYEVDNGKIVKEQFFFPVAPM